MLPHFTKFKNTSYDSETYGKLGYKYRFVRKKSKYLEIGSV